MRSFILIIINYLILSQSIYCQDEQALFVKEIYNYSLEHGHCDKWLSFLSDSIGGRLAGSLEAESAVDYTFNLLDNFPIVTSTIKQPCIVPKWIRGPKEEVSIKWKDNGSSQNKGIAALSLGNSIGTGTKALSGDIIEVFGLDTLEILGETNIKDKIVFYNRPMDPTKTNTMHAYGEAVDQRVHGASSAAKYGAAAVLVRSMTLSQDNIPHTGVQSYKKGIKAIPSLAISTNDANLISELIANGNKVQATIKNDPQVLDSVESYNVIAEIKGSEFPDEIILVGGHLDSWDVGGGAHDDGAGCVHSIQVIETLQALNYKPKRTIRCVMFMNEENGLGGGKAYAKNSNANNEFHLAAIESDSGGFTPRGFGCSAHPSVFKAFLSKFQEFETYLEPYDLFLKAGGGGADINPLKTQKGLLIGFRPDNQRYFDFHHTENDVFKNVNTRELKMGAAAITSLVYLIDQYGLDID